MKKLSKEFKLLRKSAKIIQFHIKKYLFNKHAYEEKFE